MIRHREEEPARTGTVTAVSAQTRDANRVSVFVDGRFSFGLPADGTVELGIRKGTVVDEALLERALRLDAGYRARQRALGLLAHRPRSIEEVRGRLRRAGFDDGIVDYTVQRLEDLGHLDDEAFAEAYARSRSGRRGYGPVRILSELRRKGVPEPIARRAVETLRGERDPTEDALAVAGRAWSRIGAEPDPRRRRNRMYGLLARRGFDPEVIGRVIEILDGRQP
jgi:regulatory protein